MPWWRNKRAVKQTVNNNVEIAPGMVDPQFSSWSDEHDHRDTGRIRNPCLVCGRNDVITYFARGSPTNLRSQDCRIECGGLAIPATTRHLYQWQPDPNYSL